MKTDFDALAGQVFDTVTTLYGTQAVWPAASKTGSVLFSNPTEAERIGDAENYEYRPSSYTAEYYSGTFDGLRESVDAGNSEYLVIEGQTFFITAVTARFDGKTYTAYLEPHKDEL